MSTKTADRTVSRALRPVIVKAGTNGLALSLAPGAGCGCVTLDVLSTPVALGTKSTRLRSWRSRQHAEPRAFPADYRQAASAVKGYRPDPRWQIDSDWGDSTQAGAIQLRL